MASPSAVDYISEQPKEIRQLDPRGRTEPAAVDGGDAFEEHGDGRVSLPTWATVKHKLTTRDGWFGDYDFGYLCMPQLPCSFGRGKKEMRSAQFYGLNESMPLMLAIICGLQHALAMLAGLITPPIIFAGQLGFSGARQNQMVAVSLLASGILSIVQMTRVPIPFTNKRYWLGTGLITVVGTSFATLSTASAIFSALYADGTCPSTVVNGTVVRGACPEAYGMLLGTSCLCSILPMAMSFVPPRILKRIFPPTVTGVVVLLIGAKLVGESGALNWMGGSGACRSRPAEGLFALCPSINAPHPLPWGSAEFLGLGFLSFMTIIIIEFVGSPAMRSASIILGLAVGCLVAGPLGYIDSSSIRTAPAITFLWVETFPLKIYGPAILPMLAVYISLAMEAIGDVTASSEASRQPVKGALFDSRIQGGVLADGLNGLLSGLAMNAPVSIFAQNNGVISVTRCGNRFAGYVCACFLILFGILAKISGVFLAIPNSVLGGVTTFLFASVAVSGLKILSTASFSRRDRVILAAALSFGLTTMLVKDWTSYIFTYKGGNAALKGFMNSLIIILSTPFLIAGIIASLLNATLPLDADDEDKAQHPPLLLDDDATDSLESGRHAGAATSRSARADEDDKGL
ncbi:uncharacterized protein RHOBADRAFT_17422 [Rhodotorula graminis WP1]|uniref:Purine permease n=1 Tax=Rhodotorula graminis (strain WP1) TaxID=578459 RepID=A0A0N8PZQ4_RHOGW|nr:uncharacterized protein RHOBADRAFT_17422 [Rhodotorula graminis WP1]KPV72973.1 hypothetical protein RHOBADRAFT_17422 [Rhodotorula graminis WP1]